MSRRFGIVLCLFAASTIFTFFGCGPARETGGISGLIREEYSGEPLVRAVIILAEPKENEEGCELYELRASLLAVSDDQGRFKLERVPVGTYLMVHAGNGELKAEPYAFDGIEIENMRFEINEEGDNVVIVNEGMFWQEGAKELGQCFIGRGERGIQLMDGSITSIYLGLSITATEGKLAPVVEVVNDKTANVDWKVKGR